MLEGMSKFGSFWREIVGRLSIRRDTSPIDSVTRLNEFVATRSAFVAQKTLYGYLKTRMGTRYPSMFEDDVFVESINIAKMHVYAACLSDLTIFAVAHATREQAVTDEERGDMAMTCYTLGLARNEEQAPPEFNAEEWTDKFAQRLEGTDWPFGALKRENFKQSPLNLVKWAPIAPQLKQYDTEIVENSIKFAWQEIRRQFQKGLDPEAIIADRTNRVKVEA